MRIFKAIGILMVAGAFLIGMPSFALTASVTDGVFTAQDGISGLGADIEWISSSGNGLVCVDTNNDFTWDSWNTISAWQWQGEDFQGSVPITDGIYNIKFILLADWTGFCASNPSSGDVTYEVIGGQIDPGVPPDTSTRFIEVEPAGGSTVATSTTVGATVYINEQDYEDDMYLRISFTNQTLSMVGGSALDAWNSAFGNGLGIDLPITGPGENVLSTSTIFSQIGDVNATYRVLRPTFLSSLPFLGSLFSPSSLISTTTKFTVVEKTALDLRVDDSYQGLVDLILTGTTTVPILDCDVSGFDLGKCLISIIVPPSAVLSSNFEQLRDGLLSRWPVGYVTRFVTIFSSSASSSLPVLSAVVPPGIPGEGAEIVLDLNGVLDPILNAQIGSFSNESASSEQTLYEYTSYYWEIIVYIGLGFYILRRILGSHLIPHGVSYETDTTVTPEVRPGGKATGIIHKVSRTTKRQY